MQFTTITKWALPIFEGHKYDYLFKQVVQKIADTGKASETSNTRAGNEDNTDKLVHLLEETLEELKSH